MSDEAFTSPERSDRRTAILRKLVRGALNEAGVRVGGDHLIGPMVHLIQAQCEALRERTCLILKKAEERGCVLHNPVEPNERDALSRLAFIIEHHYVDEDGEIQVAFPEED